MYASFFEILNLGNLTVPKKFAKNTRNFGWSFSDRTTFEAFQSASNLFFYKRLRRIIFFLVTRYMIAEMFQEIL